jgi:hypothetical protein
MANEPFLINPPKSLPKTKAVKKKNKHTVWHKPSASMLGKEGTLHRPRVYSLGGHWQTSPAAKIARPGLRVNPFKKNPMGEELMFIGLNPFKEVRNVKRKSSKKRHAKRSYKKNPVHFKRKRHSFRRNPMTDAIGLDASASTMKPVAAALAGGLATVIVPNLIGRFMPAANTGMMSYLTKIAVLLGGALGANKLAGKSAAIGFAGGSAVVMATQAAADYLPGIMTGSAPAPAPAPIYLPAPSVAPAAVSGWDDVAEIDYDSVGAFESMNGFERETSLGDLFYGNPLA